MRIPFPSLLLLAFAGMVLAASARAASPIEGMVLVPAGPAVVGSDNGNADEKPAHTIRLHAFYIDRTEVTNAEYQRFVQATHHAAPPDWPDRKPSPKRLQMPVVNVTWYDANAYARWVGKRLPTEEEWEKAARGSEGRLLPWGNAWEKGIANLQDGNDKDLRPVGNFPDGASPCGALDMIGNAWEWTDSWYRPYPGNTLPSVHYGVKYRVVRGGGGIDFYPPLLNVETKAMRASIRGRVQPFGRYDGIGFRCVMDADPPRRVAAEVRPLAEREKPTPPKIETPAEVARRYAAGVPVRISDPKGAGPGVATFGMPFPEGAVRSVAQIRTGTPLQARPLATWRDGSVRWALLDVPTTGKPDETVRVTWDGRGTNPRPLTRVSVADGLNSVSIDTGPLVIVIRGDQPDWLTMKSGAQEMTGPGDCVQAADEKGNSIPLQMDKPDSIRVEDRGPLRARVRVEGWLCSGQEKIVRYRCRVDARAGSASVGFVHTFTHLSPRKMLLIKRYYLLFQPHGLIGADRADFGAEGKALTAGNEGGMLRQLSATEGALDRWMNPHTLRREPLELFLPTRDAVKFTRADGWMAFGGKVNRQLIGVKHFWQQFPCGLTYMPGRTDDTIATVMLSDGKQPFEADQGLAKTHEFILSLDAAGKKRQQVLAQLDAPPFGVAPADWYCATRSLGVLAPYSLTRYPQYETEVEASSDLMDRNRPYGMRDFGDNYYGGPYKGINSFQDLEYDESYNQFMQFARTGARKYLDVGLLEARHGGDIDMKHDAGPQWKHSPRHTTIEAELGHVFLRGLVASTWISGNPEGLENAKILGDWLVGVVANPRSQGNERQIGWALYALTGIYEATWDDRYLQAMKANVDRLLAGQDILGRFSIRWDNRISFFYGITLSGFVQYYEVTHDERIAESIRRIVTRLHGFYPEYSGRTLEGLAWLYTRTGDPEVRATCQRTWETTMDHRALDIGAPTIFTVRFLPSVETLDLACPRTWQIPETGPIEDGMHRHHYRASSGDLYLQSVNPGDVVQLVLLRHFGHDQATVRAWNIWGMQVAEQTMPATGETLQYARLRLPAGGPFRVRLESTETRSWDLITAAATRRVFHVPDWKNLEALTPRLYVHVPAGATEIALTLEAEGEGFKGAVAYDPEGNVAGALAKFIDFGDTKHYRYQFQVPVPPGQDGKLWSLDLQEVSVSRAEGITPYVSTNPAAYFDPTMPGRQ